GDILLERDGRTHDANEGCSRVYQPLASLLTSPPPLTLLYTFLEVAACDDVEQPFLAAADGGGDLALPGALRAQLLHVEPGAEGPPRAGEDEHVHVAGPREIDEGGAQTVTQLAREGVERLRAIEGEGGDTVGAVDGQHGLRHGRGWEHVPGRG